MTDGGRERIGFMQKYYENGIYKGERWVEVDSGKGWHPKTMYGVLFERMAYYAVESIAIFVSSIFIIPITAFFYAIFAFIVSALSGYELPNFPDIPTNFYSMDTVLIFVIIGAVIGLITFCYDTYRCLNE